MPYTDINCEATSDNIATPDLTHMDGPSASSGLMGNPYSGNTFISGVHAGDSTYTYHEGIMQTVTGFTPNNNYSINFYQSVVKQRLALDQSGSWEVYVDTTLAGITSPTFSSAPYNSTSFVWESRNVTFTATAESHIVKFLPRDDDLNGVASDSDIQAALRMGIDSIHILSCSIQSLDLGSDTTLCQGEALTLNTGTENVAYLWQDNSTNSIFNVIEQGSYWVQITDNCGSTSDTINVDFNSEPSVGFGDDTILCEGETLALNASTINAYYLWQDNSTSQTFDVTEQGSYWVQATNICGSDSDTIIVYYNPLPIIELGNDSTLCQGEQLTLNVSTKDADYLWQDNSTDPTLNVTQQGIYWVEITVNDCISTDSIFIVEVDCPIVLELPNVFTPNSDGINDTFLPIASEGIVSMMTFIYDRWGNSIYETNNPSIGWNGHDASEGTYFWVSYYTDRNGIENSLKGIVTILR